MICIGVHVSVIVCGPTYTIAPNIKWLIGVLWVEGHGQKSMRFITARARLVAHNGWSTGVNSTTTGAGESLRIRADASCAIAVHRSCTAVLAPVPPTWRRACRSFTPPPSLPTERSGEFTGVLQPVRVALRRAPRRKTRCRRTR